MMPEAVLGAGGRQCAQPLERPTHDIARKVDILLDIEAAAPRFIREILGAVGRHRSGSTAKMHVGNNA